MGVPGGRRGGDIRDICELPLGLRAKRRGQRSRFSRSRRPARIILDKPAAQAPRGSEHAFQNMGSGTGVSIVVVVPGERRRNKSNCRHGQAR
jgi:hypothetical protein